MKPFWGKEDPDAGYVAVHGLKMSPETSERVIAELAGPPPVVFAAEPLTDELWEEATPLLVEHYREIAVNQDIPLDPDLGTYRTAVAAGFIRVFTVRTVMSQLIGYALFFVRPNPHYRGSLQAVQDVLFVTKSRRGLTGAKFIRWCDEQLAAEGVQLTFHHVKAKHNFGPMLERMGYQLVDLIYSRRLD